MGGREQAVVADLDEAGGQDVQQEAADELVGGKRGALAVLGGEGDAASIEGDEALVGDADAVGVAAEVVEDLRGAAEGRLAVDDPGLAIEVVLELGEGGGVGEVSAGAVELEFAALAGASERGEELAAEEPRHDGDREEEAAAPAGRHPAGTVGSEAAAGHDAVQVRMGGEGAGPGVEDGGDAEQPTEAAGIVAEREQRA